MIGHIFLLDALLWKVTDSENCLPLLPHRVSLRHSLASTEVASYPRYESFFKDVQNNLVVNSIKVSVFIKRIGDRISSQLHNKKKTSRDFCEMLISSDSQYMQRSKIKLSSVAAFHEVSFSLIKTGRQQHHQ